MLTGSARDPLRQTAHDQTHAPAAHAAAPSYPPPAAAAAAHTSTAAAAAGSATAAAAPAAAAPVVGVSFHYPLVRSDVNSLPVAQLHPPPGGLYIGNLAWWVTDQDLADLLCPIGELSCVRIVFDKLNGKSRGFAYAEFVRAEDAAMAMQVCSTAQLAGRHLDVAPTCYARILQTHQNYKAMPPPRKTVRPNGDGIDYEVAEFVSRAAMQQANKDAGPAAAAAGRDSHRDSSSGGRGDPMPPMGGVGPMRGPYGGMPPPPPMGLLGPMGMNPMMPPMGGGMPPFMPGMGPMNPMMGGMPMMHGPGGRMGGHGPGFANNGPPPMGMMGTMGNAQAAPHPSGPAPPARIRVTPPYEHTTVNRRQDALLPAAATLFALVLAAHCVPARCSTLRADSRHALFTHSQPQLPSMT